MSKLIDAAGNELKAKIPTVKGVKPIGTQILVELLTPNEILGTNLHLGTKANAGPSVIGAPQGYIIEIGPKVATDWGLKVGDRVVMSGNYTPLPEVAARNGRAVATVEPHVIKAVLLEK